jgi:hypothetical protein
MAGTVGVVHGLAEPVLVAPRRQGSLHSAAHTPPGDEYHSHADRD